MIAVRLLVLMALLAAPLATEAQQAGKVYRVGILSVEAAPSGEDVATSTLRAALRDLGWIAGQNMVLERRYAGGQPDRLPALAADLVRLKVDVIVTFLTPGQAGKRRLTLVAVEVACEQALSRREPQPLDLRDAESPTLETSLVMVDHDLFAAIEADLTVGSRPGIADEPSNLGHTVSSSWQSNTGQGAPSPQRRHWLGR
jgi:hypothetical protein